MSAGLRPICCRENESSFWFEVFLLLTAEVLGLLKYPSDYAEQDLRAA